MVFDLMQTPEMRFYKLQGMTHPPPPGIEDTDVSDELQ
jgi:hypothetical protein